MPELFQAREQGRQIGLRAAAVAGDDGGDAVHAGSCRRAGTFSTVAFDMRVHVDEAGREHAAGGVDGARRPSAPRQLADGGDAAFPHAHVGAEPRVARAVHHAGVADQEVVVGGRAAGRRRTPAGQ